jgi:hypothetical protein
MKKYIVLVASLLVASCGQPANAADFWGSFAGGAAGAAVGGVLTNVWQQRQQQQQQQYAPQPQQQYPQQVIVTRPVVVQQEVVVDAFTYCSRKFKSWNPETGQYRGFDGRYYDCPKRQ